MPVVLTLLTRIRCPKVPKKDMLILMDFVDFIGPVLYNIVNSEIQPEAAVSAVSGKVSVNSKGGRFSAHCNEGRKPFYLRGVKKA